MFVFLVFIEIIVSVVLIAVVLLQSSKGTGLAGSFGGSAVGTMFGVRRTSDFLTKSTTILAAALIALCLITNIFFLGGVSRGESVIQRGSPTSLPAAAAPRSAPAAQPGAQQGK